MIDYSFFISVVLLSVIGNIILYFFFANILQVGFDKKRSSKSSYCKFFKNRWYIYNSIVNINDTFL